MRKWVVIAVMGLSVSGMVCWAEEAAKPSAKPEAARPPVKPEPVMVAPRGPVGQAKVADKSELLRFVPAKPKGWTAGKPTGSTRKLGIFAVTEVKQFYKRGSQQIAFVLEDLGTNNPYFFMKEPWKPKESKSPDRYVKKVMLGKVAAEETFWKAKKRGLIFLVFESRIQLNISGTGINDTSVLVAMAKTIDLKNLKKVLDEKSK